MSDNNFYVSGQYDEVCISAQGGFFAKLFHGRMESGIPKNIHLSKVLEVGALSGQHLQHVKHGFDEWHLLDIIDSQEIFDDPRVSFTQGNVEFLPFPDDYFDRVMTTCVLHHLDNPYKALQEMRRVTKPGGIITIFLPISPGLPYELAFDVTSMRRARSRGLVDETKKAIALGHRNHYKSLRWQVLDVFSQDKSRQKWWPLGVPFHPVNIFRTFQFTKSSAER
jgi:ubiquinone/menaquinone biosynthesis C-methylase UbiE